MKLLNLFGKKAAEPQSQEQEPANNAEELGVYSGMRVEVTAFDGQILFVAKLLSLHGDQAQLHQYSECTIPLGEEPRTVRIRGYNGHEKKAVYMEGVITPQPENTWSVTELKVFRVGNDRAFFRLETNLDASMTMFSGLELGEKSCKLLNISIGGARISSERKYHEGDKFLLKVKLLADRPESAMYSQVMRVIEKENNRFEYGCQFLEMTEEDQAKITQNIFAAQRQRRGVT
mgnify:CR=1 FL=1